MPTSATTAARRRVDVILCAFIVNSTSHEPGREPPGNAVSNRPSLARARRSTAGPDSRYSGARGFRPDRRTRPGVYSYLPPTSRERRRRGRQAASPGGVEQSAFASSIVTGAGGSIRFANDPTALPLPIDEGAFRDGPIGEAQNPVTLLLPIDERAFLDLPIGVAQNPVTMLLAIDEGAFLDGPVGVAQNPVTMLLTIDEGTFRDGPIGGTLYPVTMPRPIDEGAFLDLPIGEGAEPSDHALCPRRRGLPRRSHRRCAEPSDHASRHRRKGLPRRSHRRCAEPSDHASSHRRRGLPGRAHRRNALPSDHASSFDVFAALREGSGPRLRNEREGQQHSNQQLHGWSPIGGLAMPGYYIRGGSEAAGRIPPDRAGEHLRGYIHLPGSLRKRSRRPVRRHFREAQRRRRAEPPRQGGPCLVPPDWRRYSGSGSFDRGAAVQRRHGHPDQHLNTISRDSGGEALGCGGASGRGPERSQRTARAVVA